ncbi:uncharacterized protein BXZ73DRAFT_79180 [Epithele typhae]|uniref:uncharacterized protein n=1 Tax=Epithele typhae TaxID=378194 RepID=UPI002008A1C1|nr:uncharacterized protein BXZ73DRAFT_79180 [Epithele typhae]KAH9924618.1 hypothetical protein BXZ73DRAFT_79180 [Epithele typhae]
MCFPEAEHSILHEVYNPRHPPHLSEVVAEAFTESSSPADMILGAPDTAGPTSPGPLPSSVDEQTPSNFSQSGIVHLLPVGERSRSPDNSRPTSPARTFSPNSRSGSRPYSANNKWSPSASQGQESGHSDDPSRSSSNGPSSSHSDSQASDSSALHEEYVAPRYQHVEDENGHHLIIGREGQLSRCEDEPIRAPGAVQGFGVLVAVEEDIETGNLVVRQVSENSTELLGLSPSYLFGLECLSQTFPEQQADVLFDNIQYLSDASLTAEEQAENLHVFMLSGWGAPGTASASDPVASRDSQLRRTWTCWCAAHRPHLTTPSRGGEVNDPVDMNVIILEFELERDTYNPLYPPPMSASDAGSVGSGISSPSASVSNSSGRTLVSQSSQDGASVATPDTLSTTLNGHAVSATGGRTMAHSESSGHTISSQAHLVAGEDSWIPTAEDILESTTSRARPLLALERLRRTKRIGEELPASHGSGPGSGPSRGGFRRRRGTGAVGMMDVFAVMAQINEQLGAAPDLESFLKVTTGVMKDLTQFHRVLVYQFDEAWNGQVVSELVDWNQTHDLYRGLHFPASDIPAQARQLYALNKVRLLYDRRQPTARLVVRSKEDLETPLDMTHCYLRAMSPIHLKYLENMGVRASMSVSIIAFGSLWGLVACHSYGPHGMRVSFPVRQMLRLLSQSISRNIERLSYAQRLHTRKLINTMPSDQHPSGYIVSNADDLLGLFDADYGVLVIGEGAKILGPNQHGQEILIVAEYLRLKQFSIRPLTIKDPYSTLQVSQAVTCDYPDLKLTTGLEIIAGLLYVPLSAGGRDFIAFLRKGQPRQVNWAGRPYKQNQQNVLEPRASFKTWSETVAGRCRAWSDEHLETAGVLALVYGKFIEVWRQKESALQTTKLTTILLSNASHEVRTPLNHIINLLFTINDLLDLTRLESGNETSFNEPFNLHQAIEEAVNIYRNEANRRSLQFQLDLGHCPKQVVGDCRKIRTVVANLTANALKYTSKGAISVMCHYFEEPTGLRHSGDIAVEIVVADTGCGIPTEKLESIFREFEQVESAPARPHSPGLGLGLAVVARIVEQLGGQLRVDSVIGKGSRFSFLLPLTTDGSSSGRLTLSNGSSTSSLIRSNAASRDNSRNSRTSEIDSLVDALSSSHMGERPKGMIATGTSPTRLPELPSPGNRMEAGRVEITGSANPLKPVKMDGFDLDPLPPLPRPAAVARSAAPGVAAEDAPKLRILIVEDNDINRMILAKRLSLDGHNVVNTTNGQEGLEMVETDRHFDCVLMDIQMPLLNGYEATERIRALEEGKDCLDRISHKLNGRIPIFAVSASLFETQREELYKLGMDGWILKPIDFKRLRTILRGITDPIQREKDVYHTGSNWEVGGWLSAPDKARRLPIVTTA